MLIGIDENVLDVSDSVQYLFNTDIFGALMTTFFASLIWRIIASSYPIAFLSNPLIYLLAKLCLLADLSGLCTISRLVALSQRQISGLKRDDVYVSKLRRESTLREGSGYIEMGDFHQPDFSKESNDEPVVDPGAVVEEEPDYLSDKEIV